MTDTKKIALVTGTNNGIGLEIARQLAQKGVTVLMGARFWIVARMPREISVLQVQPSRRLPSTSTTKKRYGRLPTK
jgi:NADP-dependent 3-hydroxy acid dehydrogenase YdfG